MNTEKKVIKKAAKKVAKKSIRKKSIKKEHPNWGGKRVAGTGKKYQKRDQRNILDKVIEDLENATLGAIKLLQKEKGIPIPPGKIFNEIEQLKVKLQKLVPTLKIGESFVVPIKRKGITAKYLYHNFKENVFRIRKIEDNPEYARVWLIR